MNITSPYDKKYDLQEIYTGQKKKMPSSTKKESQEPAKSDRSGRSAIKSPYRCATLNSIRNFTKI